MSSSRKARLVAAALTPLTALAIGVAAAGTADAAQNPSQTVAAPRAAAHALNVPVTGTTSNGTFAGVLHITRFQNVNGRLVAVGTVTGALTDAASGATRAVNQPMAAPVAQAAGSCQVLNLVLGPLNLNLLGLVVTLNQVHLNITAQSGPGNLLGNLLCAVAGLLNGGGALGGLSGLLNQILAAL